MQRKSIKKEREDKRRLEEKEINEAHLRTIIEVDNSGDNWF